MHLLQSIRPLQRRLSAFLRSKQSIGFVPTMGYLHEGHLSLVRAARQENDGVAVSIFVNPLQFGPREDLKRYPRDLTRYLALLRKAGVNFVFVPSNHELYPDSFQTSVAVKHLSLPLCGASRPTHFSGVASVVLKLLNIVKPQRLYLGQKDFQQIRVLETLIEDLNLGVEVRRMPIVRDRDGLAMSSRNYLLKKDERRQAILMHTALLECRDCIESGERDAKKILKSAQSRLRALRLGRRDYFEIVDAEALKPVVKLKKGQTVLAAAAYIFSKTRLIDNELIKVE